MTTVAFLGVVRSSSLVSGAGGVVSVSVLDVMERAAAGSSTVVEGEDSAAESLLVVTHPVLVSVLDVGPATVPSSLEQVLSIVLGGSPSAAVDVLRPEVERLNVASLSPGPVDICVDTAATVVNGCVTVAWGSVDVAVRTEGGLYVLNNLIDQVKPCVFFKKFIWLCFSRFLLIVMITDVFVSLIRDLLR